MAGDPDITRQERVIGAVVLWSGLFGIVLVITLIIWALQPGHVGRLQTNNLSDQPATSSTTNPNGRTTTGDAGTGNNGTSGNATRLGSGPFGAPRGSSGNVSGSNPPNATTRSETTGSSTR